MRCRCRYADSLNVVCADRPRSNDDDFSCVVAVSRKLLGRRDVRSSSQLGAQRRLPVDNRHSNDVSCCRCYSDVSDVTVAATRDSLALMQTCRSEGSKLAAKSGDGRSKIKELHFHRQPLSGRYTSDVRVNNPC